MIRYELIGTHPQVQHLQSNLSAVISTYEELRTRTAKHTLGTSIVRAAEHFYGMSIEDYGCMRSLIDSMRATDQRLMVS